MEYLLVDAYNVINAWGEIFDFSIMTLEDCRDKLLHIMSNYQGYNGDSLSVIVVFDAHMARGGKAAGGPGNGGTGGTRVLSIRGALKAAAAGVRNNLQASLEAVAQSFTGASAGAIYFYDNIIVVYTKANETADNFIERFVYLKGETDTVRVVTSDYLEQTMILRKGGVRILPRELKEAVRAASRVDDASSASRGVWTEVRPAKPGGAAALEKAGQAPVVGGATAGDGNASAGLAGARTAAAAGKTMTAAGVTTAATGVTTAATGINKSAITLRITTIDSLLNEKVAEKLEDIRRGREFRPEGGEGPK